MASTHKSYCLRAQLPDLQSETDAVIVYDLNIRISSQIFPELGDKYIHASSHEIIIVSPDLR